jgi:hypothetical protein
MPMTVTREPAEAVAGVKLTVITKSANSLRSAIEAPFWRSAGLSAWKTCWISSVDGCLSPTGLTAIATAGMRDCGKLVQLVATHRAKSRTAKTTDARFISFLPNVQDEPRPWLARAVLLGARIVTAMVVGSGALLGRLRFGDKCCTSNLNLRVSTNADDEFDIAGKSTAADSNEDPA